MDLQVGIIICVGVFAGVIGGIGGPLLIVLLKPRKKCPDCGELLPRMRNCWDGSGAVRRCGECGCRVDVKGRRVGKKKKR